MSRAHRLAAIMFTDIQGYTKLMQENEDKAIEIRDRHREVFQTTTLNNNGEILQYYGDGTLSIFNSCVDAVRCAIQMQEEFQSDHIIPVRVGIHLGDITLTEDDIIGNSVNIASRVESLGIPGNVLISQKVYDEIRNKQEFQTQKLGEFHFKNDKVPRTIYALSGGKLVVPKKHELQGKLETKKSNKNNMPIYRSFALLTILLLALWAVGLKFQVFNHKIESLAVLPLNDRIGLLPEEDYIIEGLHEEIVTKLSKAGLNVKPYSTMVHYRDNPKTPTQISEELNVDGLVEGSVFRSDNVYRIRVQIINAKTQEYVSEPYEAEAEFANIMTIYTDLVENIANQIKYTLSDKAQAYLAQNPRIDPMAYDMYLRGQYYFDEKGNDEDLKKAIEFYNLALEKDPTFGDAHVALVESYLLLGFSSNSPLEEMDKFRYHLASAIEMDPFFAADHHLMAMVKVFDNWDWSGAAEELEKAMDASPKSWEPFDSYCQLMWAMGDMEKSIEAGKQAVKIEPNAHFAHCDLAWAYYFDKNIEQASIELNKTIQKFGKDCPHHSGLAIFIEINNKLKIGQSLNTTIDKIKREVYRTGNPAYNLSVLGYAHALEGNREKAIEILKEVESEDISGADKIYMALGDFDRALEILDASISNRSFFQMYSIKQAPWFDPLRNDPRFDRILTKMGLGDNQLNQ